MKEVSVRARRLHDEPIRADQSESSFHVRANQRDARAIAASQSMNIMPSDESPFAESLLLRELTHRINNELAATIGFVSFTAARSSNDDVKIALAAVTEHIHDFARIYRALQMPATDIWIDSAVYLRDLCQCISRAKLHHRGIELVFVECPLTLSALRCWRLGMIVSELITNACRHAFRESGGRIQVELFERDAFVECAVTDNGSGLENIEPGQGMKIIRSLVHDLHGTIDHRSGTIGTRAVLCFPRDFADGEPGPLTFTSTDLR
jgi:two-component sensor histidine kinase